MRKVLIFGNSGSGKSTLAQHLSEKENLAHIDLDTIAWLLETPPNRAPLESSNALIDEFVQQNPAWVIEGCYTDLLKLSEKFATEAIFLNPGEEQCIANAKARPWEPHKYASKEEQDKNLEMLIEWIKGYYSRDDEMSYKRHLEFYEGFQNRKLHLTSNLDPETFPGI